MSFISNCCGATPYLGNTDYGRCSDCKENCEFEIEQELDDCDICYGQGYVHSNDKEGNDEIQRCDNCEKFDNDLEAQSFYKDMGFPDEESDECICNDNGYFITKSKYVEDQVTKCYECNLYVSDEEAKNDLYQVEFDMYEHLERTRNSQ